MGDAEQFAQTAIRPHPRRLLFTSLLLLPVGSRTSVTAGTRRRACEYAAGALRGAVRGSPGSRTSLSMTGRYNKQARPQRAQGMQSMLSEADRHKAADILMTAEKERKQAVQLSKTWPDIQIEDSYAISTEVA